MKIFVLRQQLWQQPMAAERGGGGGRGIGQEERGWIYIDHLGRENKLHNTISYVTTNILLKNQLNFTSIVTCS